MSDNPFYWGNEGAENNSMPSYESGSDWQIPESQFQYEAPTNMQASDFSQGNLWDRLNFNTNTPKGMDNWFNAGAGGLGLLQTALQLKDQEDQKKDFRRAEGIIRGQMNPNQQLFEQRIMSMMDNPAGYLNDPVDNTMAQEATTAAERMAAKQGRPGMSLDDLRRIQAIKRGSYDNRLKTLVDLYGQARANNSGVASALANLQQRRPSGSATPIIGGLGALYSAGRNIAADSGIASDVRQPADDRFATLRR